MTFSKVTPPTVRAIDVHNWKLECTGAIQYGIPLLLQDVEDGVREASVLLNALRSQNIGRADLPSDESAKSMKLNFRIRHRWRSDLRVAVAVAAAVAVARATIDKKHTNRYRPKTYYRTSAKKAHDT